MCNALLSYRDATLLKFNPARRAAILICRSPSDIIRWGRSLKGSVPNVAQNIAQYPIRLLCRSCARGDRCIARRTIGSSCEHRSKEARQATATSSSSIRQVPRTLLHAARGSASCAGVRLSAPGAAKRDQRAGLHIRARRRDSRRVMRPANQRMHERVPRRSLTGARES